jgi:hypothetical protein
MRSAEADLDLDEVREKVSDLADYLEKNGQTLKRLGGHPLAKELKPLVRRLLAVGNVLEIIVDSDK